ncbi:MAG: hypothetical protein QF473_00550 [Planctomycetota bacterium]|nr:hypothetical protein [Planctomycetota bacterium]
MLVSSPQGRHSNRTTQQNRHYPVSSIQHRVSLTAKTNSGIPTALPSKTGTTQHPASSITRSKNQLRHFQPHYQQNRPSKPTLTHYALLITHY